MFERKSAVSSVMEERTGFDPDSTGASLTAVTFTAVVAGRLGSMPSSTTNLTVRLSALGLEDVRPIAKTGVTGIVKGSGPEPAEGSKP